jgi:hypothetical protein
MKQKIITNKEIKSIAMDYIREKCIYYKKRYKNSNRIDYCMCTIFNNNNRCNPCQTDCVFSIHYITYVNGINEGINLILEHINKKENDKSNN